MKWNFFKRCHKKAGVDTLCQRKAGESCLVIRLNGCAFLVGELRRMGVVEGEELRVVGVGKCLLVECGGARIAVCRRLASAVEVELVN